MGGNVRDNGPDDTICAATSNQKRERKTITLHHHVFSNGGGWQQRRSLPQPTVSLTAYACKEDYEHFGMPLSSYPRGGQVTAIVDTGCQSCLIGLKMVYRLGFKRADLLPVEHKMSAANRQLRSLGLSFFVYEVLTAEDILSACLQSGCILVFTMTKK